MTNREHWSRLARLEDKGNLLDDMPAGELYIEMLKHANGNSDLTDEEADEVTERYLNTVNGGESK